MFCFATALLLLVGVIGAEEPDVIVCKKMITKTTIFDASSCVVLTNATNGCESCFASVNEPAAEKEEDGLGVETDAQSFNKVDALLEKRCTCASYELFFVVLVGVLLQGLLLVVINHVINQSNHAKKHSLLKSDTLVSQCIW